jgi:hypothetical protein
MTKTLPPDPENRNDERARWATAALRAFHNETGVDEEDALADLLCDLMHSADREDWDFAVELERAQANYQAEITPDATDLLGAARLVIARWSLGDLAEAVRHLQDAVSYASSEAP